ncbi:hypothetical protein [Phnomibacter ginsenosidimutans]|uniref:Uncharacterized protein n=1 Tax=Phnomibacter ginsenosidimutans TaxID=2676868 RepID=A0A6I6GP13_9BACT|nr:hypothetical protein [Phnomibacter ginsenosidimutans]QGW26819.1 hypothetical protein GLV81_00705 [Phnomibacter ginsenosidimutans]
MIEQITTEALEYTQRTLWYSVNTSASSVVKKWKYYLTMKTKCRIIRLFIVPLSILFCTASVDAQTGIPLAAIKGFEKAYGTGTFGKRYILFNIDTAQKKLGWKDVGPIVSKMFDSLQPITKLDLNGDKLQDYSITLVDQTQRALAFQTVFLCMQMNGEYSICSPPNNHGYLPSFVRPLRKGNFEWIYAFQHLEQMGVPFEYKTDTITMKNGYWIKSSKRPVHKKVVKIEYWTTSAWVPQPRYLYTFSKTNAPMLELRNSAYSPNPTKEEAAFYTMVADSGFAKLIWQMIGRVNEHDLLDMNSGGADRAAANLVFHFADGTSKTITDYGMDNNLTFMAFYDLVNKLPKSQWKKLDGEGTKQETSGNH